MANKKLSALTELTSVAVGDFVPINDVSDLTDGSNGTSKKITVNNLVTGIISGSVVDTASAQSITGEKTFTHLTILNGTTSANGISFGSDVNLYRSAADELRTDDNLLLAGGVTAGNDYKVFNINDGVLFSGASSGAYDVNLYGSAANTLKTDDDLHVVGNVVIDPAGAATKTFTLGVVATLEQNSGLKVGLLQDNPLRVVGVSGAAGTIFQVQNNAGTKFFDSYATGGQVLNEDGADYDLRVEGDTDPSLIVADASADRVGIGTNAPDQKLTVAGAVHIASTTATTAGGATAVTIGSSPSLGIYFGSGVPSISAPQGSLYLRTEGSSTSTRAYINTNGSTTWTAITTAA